MKYVARGARTSRYLVPRSEWGKQRVHAAVARGLLLLVGGLVLPAVALMYLGDGGLWTWIGLALYLGLLAGFTGISLRGIRRPRAQSPSQ